MKRITFILLFLLMNLYGFTEEKQLQSLKNGETFSVEYGSGLLKVYRISDSKRDLYFDISTHWGAYQLSRDKQQLIVFSDEKKMFYLLDGKTGSFKPITDKPSNSMTSFDLKYIIWQKDYGDIWNRSRVPTVVITELINNKDILEISWNELQQYFEDDYSFGYLFVRSNEPDYDFFVYASGEGPDNYFGLMKINVEKKIYKKQYPYDEEIKTPHFPPEYYGLE